MKKLFTLVILFYIPIAIASRPYQSSSVEPGAQDLQITQHALSQNLTPANLLLGAKIMDPGVFTNTQMNDSSVSSVNGFDPTTEFQSTEGNAYATEALVGGVVAPPDSTVHQVQGVSGYAVNKSSGGESGSAAVGVYGQGRCNSGVDGNRCWGANFIAAARTDGGANPTSRIRGVARG